MTKRIKHPSKEIEAAIQYAEKKGWRYKEAGSSAHAWGRMLCPQEDREGHSMSVWSTPRDTDNHAKQIRRNVNACPHKREEGEK